MVCSLSLVWLFLAQRDRFNKSFDASRDSLNTLSDQTEKLIDQLDSQSEPVVITAYISDDLVQENVKDLLQLYALSGAKFKVEYVDPNADPARVIAAKLTSPNTLVISYGDRVQRLTVFNEEKLTNALVNVLKADKKKIYFTSGHGEGSISATEAAGFSAIVDELQNSKYEVSELALLETGMVPDDADLVVIGGPKYDFRPEETSMLNKYLESGGALLAMVNAMTPVDNINELLKSYGITFNNDFIILPPDDIRAQFLGQNNAIVSEFDSFHPVTKDFAAQSAVSLVLGDTRSLDVIEDNQHNLKVTAAAKTAASLVRVKDVRGPKDLENLTEDRWEFGSFPVMAVASGATAPKVDTTSNPAPNDDLSTDGGDDPLADDSLGDGATTAAQDDDQPAESSGEIRLVVTGSVQFANNGRITQVPEHRDAFLNMTNFLLKDEDFISIRPKDPTKSSLQITSRSSQVVLLGLSFLYPFLFLGAGGLVWLRRRNT